MKQVLLGLFLLFAALNPALADAISDRVVAHLNEQGYTVREMSRTWLGRMWVLADNGTVQREVVFNPGTGEILRDYAVLMSDLPDASGGSGAEMVARDHDNNESSRLSASATASAPSLGVGVVAGDQRGADNGRVVAPQEVVVEPLNPLQ